MTARRLLIVGTGRSATGYIAATLTAAGAACGHESVFGPAQALGINPPRWHHYAADASWLGIPAIARGLHPGPIRIQLRDPLTVIDSLDRLGLLAWETDRGHNAYRGAIATLAPEVFTHPRAIARAAHFTATWPWLSGDHPAYAIEDLDPAKLLELLELIGAAVPAPTELPTVDPTTNAARAPGPRRAPAEVARQLRQHVPGDIVNLLLERYGPYYPTLEALLR